MPSVDHARVIHICEIAVRNRASSCAFEYVAKPSWSGESSLGSISYSTFEGPTADSAGGPVSNSEIRSSTSYSAEKMEEYRPPRQVDFIYFAQNLYLYFY